MLAVVLIGTFRRQNVFTDFSFVPAPWKWHFVSEAKWRDALKARGCSHGSPRVPAYCPAYSASLGSWSSQPACYLKKKASHALTKTLLYIFWSWMLLWVAVSVSECPRNNSLSSLYSVWDGLFHRPTFLHYFTQGRPWPTYLLNLINYSLGIIILNNNSKKK